MSNPTDHLAAGGHEMAPPLFAMQAPGAAAVFTALRAEAAAAGQPIVRVIEIGTGRGGLALFLARTFTGVETTTCDVDDDADRDALLRRHGVTVHIGDAFSKPNVDLIARQIRRPGRTLLLCDGGDKAREFGRFSNDLKHGDIIMVHDYATSRLQFVENVQGRHWDWCELTYADVAAACRRNRLVAIRAPDLAASAWGAFRKDDNASEEDLRAAGRLEPEDVALVFATIDRRAVNPASPQYLHATLSSMLAADPLVHRTAGVHLVVGDAPLSYIRDFLADNRLFRIHPCPEEQLRQQRGETPHDKLTRTYIRCLDVLAGTSAQGAILCEDDCRFRDGWLGYALEAANEMRATFPDSMLALYSAYSFEGVGGFYRGETFCSYGPSFYGLVACYYDRSAAASAGAYLREHFGTQPADLLIGDWSNLRFNRYAMPRSVVQHMGAVSAGTSVGSMNNSATFHLPVRRWGPDWSKPARRDRNQLGKAHQGEERTKGQRPA